MDIHDRAWEQFKLLILAKKPMLAMQIEQSIAAANPASEAQVFSFAGYDEAYKFCKQQKDVGFFFIHEDCGDVPFLSVFREFSRHYENFNAPAFGTILYDREPQPFSEKTVGKNPLLLDYIPVESVLNPDKTLATLKTTWNQFTEAFESAVLSKDLQASLMAIAEKSLGEDSVHFISRLTINLLSELNVSWFESVAINLAPFLAVVQKEVPVILEPHPILSTFIETCKVDHNVSSEDLLLALTSQVSLPKKVALLVNYCEQQRKQGTLAQYLDAITPLNKPGAAKLIRHIVKNKERILAFHSDAESLRSAG